MAPQARSLETRSHILQAALAGFAEQGYDATGVADICARAGVSKGAFYHHFPSKQALFLALLDEWLRGLDQQLVTQRAAALTVPEGMQAMFGLLRLVFADASGKLPMFLEFWRQAARDPVVWQASMAPYQRYQALFVDLIEAGVAEGTLRPIDPRAGAQAVISLVVGLLFQSLLDPTGTDWGQVAEDSLSLLLHGLLQTRLPTASPTK